MSASRVRQITQLDSRWSIPADQKNFGSLRCDRGFLPLEELHLQGAIRGLDFTVTLTQVFYNLHHDSLEAVYIFPLPARAAVSAFTMKTQNRVVEGLLQERSQARANYQQAIQAGQQAALVEEERPDIFTMTVGNIPARQAVTVTLVLEGPLSCIDDVALFRFPLVVAPKYIPGVALPGGDVGHGTHHDTQRAHDASRITPPVLLPGYPNPVRLSIELELDSPLLNWQELESTLPMQLTESGLKKRKRRGGQTAKLVYLPEAGHIDHDFILSFPFHPQKMLTSLQVQEDDSLAATGSFPFCLTVVPPAFLSEKSPEKQVVILLDRSGSMNGWKMLAAQRTVARLIDSLNSDDSFCILAFDDQVEEIRPSHTSAEPRSQTWFKLNQSGHLTEATDRNRCDYADALKAVTARGGTEIAGALDVALQKLPSSPSAEIEQHIVLVTDGQVGNEGEILDMLRHEARGIRVSTIGIDQAVNAAFLEQVAATTRGLCQLVQSDAQLDRSMTEICRRIGNPALKDIKILDANVSELVFQHKDLYPGLATRIYGLLTGPVPEKVKLSAVRLDGSLYTQDVEVLSCSGTVEKLWARERVLQMEHEFHVCHDRRELANLPARITEFSLRYGVMCRFTAFVAIDKQSQVPTQRRTVVQAVETPAGWAETGPLDLLSSQSASRVSDGLLWCSSFDADTRTERAGKSAMHSMNALESLAKSKPTKVAEMLKSTWLGGDSWGGNAVPPSDKKGDMGRATPDPTERIELLKRIKELIERKADLEKVKAELLAYLVKFSDDEPETRQPIVDFLSSLAEGKKPNYRKLEAWLKALLKQLDPDAPSEPKKGLLNRILGR